MFVLNSVVFIGVAFVLGVMAIPHDIVGVAFDWASRARIQTDLPLPCPLPLLLFAFM